MSEYIPKYPSNEDDDSNKTPSELLAETLRPIYVPQDLMLAWEMHLASYSSDTNALLDQVRDSEADLNTQYQALLTRVQRYEQMLQDITMDSNEFTMDTDEVNFTGWNILAQASYWDYLLRKEITKLSDQIKGAEYKGGLVTEVTDAVLGGLIANNTYISNVIEALSNTPLIQELDAALNSTSSSLSDLQAEYVRLAEKQVADAEALANQLVDNAEQLTTSLEAAVAEQLDRIAEEAAIRTQLLQELEAKTDAMTIEYTAAVDALHTTVIQELNGMQDGITSSVAQLQIADEAIITSLDAYKVSNGQNIAALQSTVTTVSNTQESITTQVTGLIASFDQLDIGLSQAQADIVTSNQARADGDEALSQQITTLNSGLGGANSRIDTVSTAVSTLGSSTATKFSELESTLEGVDDSITSVRQIANTAASNNTAQASEITALKSRMAVTEGDVITKADATALSTLETKVDNADSVLSTRIDSLVANLTSSEGTEINANAFNTLRAEVTTNTGNITTHTSQITALNSSLSNVNTGVSANADAVADLRTTVTQQGGSITSHSQAIQQLQSDLDVAEAGLSTKASTTALNTTNTNVSNIDGRVTANTNSLNSLGSRMGTVEGAVTTKLDASVISNYYTKGQAADKSAEIVAGKIESYDANLVIGGTNLLIDSDKFRLGNNPYGLSTQIMPDGSLKLMGSGSTFAFWANSSTEEGYVGINAEEAYTVSLWFKAVDTTNLPTTNPQLYLGDGHGYMDSFKIVGNLAGGKEVRYIQTRTAINDLGVLGIPHFNFPNGSLGGGLILTKWQLERGSKGTDWKPSSKDTAEKLAANSNAIQTVTAEVARVNGEVVSTANSVSTLSSNVGLLQGSINEVRQTVTNNQESTNTLVTSLKSGMTDADDVSMMMRNATVLFEDLNFRNGNNGVDVYNNHLNGALACSFTNKLPDNPVTSTRQLQFIHSGGATTPALGGFRQETWSRANGVFLVKFVAKLPVGFIFGLAANAYGDGASHYFIGGNEGTGKFKTYYAVYRCGATGGFSTVGFVYVNGQHPTPENPLIWYLASSTVYDCLDSKVAPDSVVNGIAEAKSTASTAVTKADATALIAQNLQASLDNTNANISTNYYTKAEADNAVAGKVEQFSSTIAVGGANLWSVINATRISELGSHSVTVKREDEEELWITVNSLSGGASLIRFDSCLVDQNTPFIDGEDVVLSFEVSSNAYHRLGTVYAYVGGYASAIFNANLVTDPSKWQRIVHKFKATGVALNGPNQLFGIRLHAADGWNVGATLSIRHVQLQRGNTATAFSKSSAITRATVKETAQSINGIEAIKTVTIDNNGVMSGYGLISQLKNGQVTSAFGVNADTFYIGGPALNKKPFLVTSYPQNIDGITYPPGTWINSAIIANATIGSAHIADAAITNAKIANATIDNAKIANLDAAKINTGTLSADRIGSKSITSDRINVTSLSAISVTIGTLRTRTSGSRLEIRDDIIEVFDANGRVRVQLGIF